MVPSKPLNAYMRYSGLGMQMAVIICLGVWGGQRLDAHYQTKEPLFTVFLSLFAVIVSLIYVIRGLLRK